jgi:archaellum biogenesis protein FlaJ (TadC family)
MDPFDELRSDWKSAPVPELPPAIMHTIVSQQRKLIFTNLAVSLSFAVVFVVLGWVFTSYEGRTPAFYTSIILMYVLLIVYLGALWASVIYRKPDPLGHTSAYVDATLRKLRLRKYLLEKGTPLYGILLTAILFFYYSDVLMEASLMFKLSAYGLTTAYIIATHWFSRKKRRRMIDEVDALIDDLNSWLQPNG